MFYLYIPIKKSVMEMQVLKNNVFLSGEGNGRNDVLRYRKIYYNILVKINFNIFLINLIAFKVKLIF